MFGSSFLFIPFSPGSGASGVPPFRCWGRGKALYCRNGGQPLFQSPLLSAHCGSRWRSGRSATGKRWRLKKITSRVKENRRRNVKNNVVFPADFRRHNFFARLRDGAKEAFRGLFSVGDMVFVNVGFQCAAWAWNGALNPVFLSLLHVRFYLNFGKLFSCFFVKSFPKKNFWLFLFCLDGYAYLCIGQVRKEPSGHGHTNIPY